MMELRQSIEPDAAFHAATRLRVSTMVQPPETRIALIAFKPVAMNALLLNPAQLADQIDLCAGITSASNY